MITNNSQRQRRSTARFVKNTPEGSKEYSNRDNNGRSKISTPLTPSLGDLFKNPGVSTIIGQELGWRKS